MKRLFYIGLGGLTLFEVARVYFIMPMPGSQEMESLDVAYFLHSYRWYFRVLFGVLVITGMVNAFEIRQKWIPSAAVLAAGIITYLFNFYMTAESIFETPQSLSFAAAAETKLRDSTLVMVAEYNGEAKAYPIRYIGYHHQVRDTVGGMQMMITYCTVCRTGRVFEPRIGGKTESFRLVGMDHYNAMFEDASTKSWWRQVTGQAVAGPLKGHQLPEIPSAQMTLGMFFSMYPFGTVMEAEQRSMDSYDTLGRYEKGRSKGALTRTDSLSWQDKSWVIGVEAGKKSKAYDWNKLKADGLIHDVVGNVNVVVVMSKDGQSFAVFERADSTTFTTRNDTLFSDTGMAYSFKGNEIAGQGPALKKVKAYQEFWHSWRTFHPETEKHE